MCGRFSQTTDIDRLRQVLGFKGPLANLRPRWNIAPTQEAAIVRDDDGERRLEMLRWGLVPYWAEEPSIGARMINARGETLNEKPAFKAAYKSRRCLVPADGFYEWEEKGADRRPFLFRRAGGEMFTFAGLWEKWVPEGGGVMETFAIISCASDGSAMARYHTRTPVVIAPEDHEAWLGPAADPRWLIRPPQDGMFEAVRVSTYVNKTANDDSNCFTPAPVDEGPQPATAKPKKAEKKKDDRQASLF